MKILQEIFFLTRKKPIVMKRIYHAKKNCNENFIAYFSNFPAGPSAERRSPWL